MCLEIPVTEVCAEVMLCVSPFCSVLFMVTHSLCIFECELTFVGISFVGIF